MEPIRVQRSFRSFSQKGLRITLNRLRSKSRSSLNSPRSPATPRASPGGGSNRNLRSREDELREVFRRFDGDEDGKISAVEIRAYLASIGEHMSTEEAQGVIHELDGDGDGLIDFEDFRRMMRDEGGSGDDLKAAFEVFELEKGSGRITPKSLQKVLSRLGESKSYDECAAMIRVFDADGNGELDFHEFHQMMA